MVVAAAVPVMGVRVTRIIMRLLHRGMLVVAVICLFIMGIDSISIVNSLRMIFRR